MRYTNEQINWNLTGLRNDLRDGNAKILGPEYVKTFRFAVARQMDPNVIDLNSFFSDYRFNPQTVKRFEKLFEVPSRNNALGETTGPTQDDFAWAIQNFINRRAEPWAFLNPKPAEPATETVSV